MGRRLLLVKRRVATHDTYSQQSIGSVRQLLLEPSRQIKQKASAELEV